MATRNIWIISDTHINHENIIKYSNRPFANVHEMNEAMCDNWNDTVKNPTDIVYHLGDVYMGLKDNGKEKTSHKGNLLFKLRGRKRLILGNHDNAKDPLLHKVFQKISIWRMFPEFGVLLTHVPVHPSSLNPDKCRINIHGHIHTNVVLLAPGIRDRRYKNVCVEHTNYRPVNIEDLRSYHEEEAI